MAAGAENRNADARELIQNLIHEELRYIRHYSAKVALNVDPEAKGRVLVTCDALGWSNPATGGWAALRGIGAMVVPNIGDEVDIYFMDGDPDQCVCAGIITERQTLKKYDLPTTAVVFEDKITGDSIVYNSLTSSLAIKTTLGLKVGAAAEPMVLGTKLNSVLTAIISAINTIVSTFNSHTHVETGGTTATGLPQITPPTIPAPSTTSSLLNKLD